MGKTPDLGQQAEALRELIREANGTVKDLNAAVTEARKTAPAIVNEQIAKAVAEGLATYGKTIGQAQRDAEQRVIASFDKLAATLMGTTPEARREGKPSIPELVHEMTREPETVTDPRQLGGDIKGAGPHGKGNITFDTRGAVLVDYVEVAVVEDTIDGTRDTVALLLDGGVNGTKNRAKVLYLISPDGAAAIVTQIERLMRRGLTSDWPMRYEQAKARCDAEMRAREVGE